MNIRLYKSKENRMLDGVCGGIAAIIIPPTP
ncbi:MAG: PspC domain-containing protein [Dorea sp.]|nr:PspC domain-containing protein [Dorea sp.]MDY2812620.1 PspC domain-containing protein [Dorea sp.]